MKWCPLECWGQESNHYLGQQSVDECVDWNQQTKYPWFKYCSKLWVQIYTAKPVLVRFGRQNFPWFQSEPP